MDFVVFSDDWGRRPSAPQHLFAVLARRHRILWVEPAGLRRPRLSRADIARSAHKLRGFLPSGAPGPSEDPWLPQPDSLVRLVPPIIPAYGVASVRRANDAVLTRRVRAALAAEGFDAPVLVTTIPTVAGVLGALGERCSVYWRVDDFSLWPGYDAAAITEREGVLLERADALLASAPGLLAAGPRIRQVFPHGVDLEHFSAPPAGPSPLPGAGPHLLVAGRLDGRIDVELLRGIAARRPQAQLVLLGDALAVPAALADLPNVQVHPHVPYAELPSWLHAAQVLLIPYRCSPWTDSLAPLKVREYLATGRPVVSTPLRGILQDPELEGLVGIASGLDATLRAVDAAVVEPSGRGAARMQAMAGMSWSERAGAFESLISLLTSPAI